MQVERTIARIKPSDSGDTVVAAGVARFEGTFDTFKSAEMNTVVDYVDNTANSAGTETQRGRPAQYFDALSQQRFRGDSMVGADV